MAAPDTLVWTLSHFPKELSQHEFPFHWEAVRWDSQSNMKSIFRRSMDAHKATFGVSITAVVLDLIVCLSALYPYYWEVEDFSFLNLDQRADGGARPDLILLTALPIVSLLFAVLLIVGNRLRIWQTYLLFLVTNSVLAIWNVFVVIMIYIRVIPELNKQDIAVCSLYNCAAIKTKLHIYAALLLLTFIVEVIFDVVVWFGWRHLRTSKRVSFAE